MNLKQKNIALLVGFIILIWLTYSFSISKTIAARSTYNNLSHQKEIIANIPQQVNYLKQQNKYYDSILKENKITTGISLQNNLLQILNFFVANNELKIIDFKEPHSIIKSDAILKTYSFTVKGSYTNILQLINKLEQQGNFGKLISVNFQKKKNYKMNRSYLESNVLLQKTVRNTN